MGLKKPVTCSSASGSSSVAPSAGKMLSGYPTLLEFLSMRSWPDGESRELGKMTLYVEGNLWKSVLNDPGNRRYAFVTGQTVDDVFACLDDGLERDTLDWRVSKPWNPEQGRKR